MSMKSTVQRFHLLIAAALTVALSGASPLLAETAGRVSGHALDAGGRPLAHLPVQLVESPQGAPAGVPVRTVVTDGGGAWSFGAVPVGEYVVRVVDRGRTTGLPVSVTDASGASGLVIVAPSLLSSGPAPQAQGAAAGAAAGAGVSTTAIVVGAVAAAAAAAVVVVVVSDES
jgi:hypothetical protein